MRVLRVHACVSLLALLLPMASGCAMPRTTLQAELKTLKREIATIRQEAGELDPTIKVLLVFLSRESKNNTLIAMTIPKVRFIATDRFVTVLIRRDEATLMYKNQVRSYVLPPRDGIAWTYRYYPGGQDYLYAYFLKKQFRWSTHETLVVTDLQLNVIESEEAPWNSKTRAKWLPAVISRYGTLQKEDYEKWMSKEIP